VPLEDQEYGEVAFEGEKTKNKKKTKGQRKYEEESWRSIDVDGRQFAEGGADFINLHFGHILGPGL
jgi:hypothetical protein